MKIIKKISQMQKLVLKLHEQSKSVGFVPTMGALHEGHLSLTRRARKENDVVVVSIFVNPAQFGPEEDLKKYPRNLKKDAGLCRKVGVDYIFAPSAREMYPDNYITYINVEGYLTETLEGRVRPGHFRGVTTIVAKLFSVVQPDRAYFGEKDYQQLLVVKKMVDDLNIPVKIIPCPIIRQGDGLAMSSRNAYLSSEERRAARVLSRALRQAKKVSECQSIRVSEYQSVKVSEKLKNKIKEIIKKEPGVKIDYVEICDGRTLEPVKKIRKDCIILVAARIGKTRLIDNIKI